MGYGIGGLATLLPFVAGVSAPIFLHDNIGSVCAALGVCWIVGVQFTLYKRINALYAKASLPLPLNAHWVVIPGLNLIAGLRSVHFLSEVHARNRGELTSHDVLAKLFPVIGKETLTAKEVVTKPALWIRL